MKQAIAAAVTALLLASCVSVERYSFSDEDFAELEPKLQEEFRRQAAKVKAKFANSFRTQVCAAAQAGDEEAATYLTGRLQPQLSDYSRALATSGVPQTFTSGELRASALGSEPMSRQVRARAGETVIEVTPDRRPQASAQNGRILLSLGLVQALCRETDTSVGLATIDLAIRGEGVPESDSRLANPFATSGNQMQNLAFGELELQRRELSFINALYFVVSHELSHLLLDPTSNVDVTRQLTEVRGDLVGLFALEALSGRYEDEADRRRQLARTSGWRIRSYSEFVTMLSDEGHKTVFEMVYIKAGLVEPGREHLPFDERVRLLNYFAEQLSTPAPRRSR